MKMQRHNKQNIINFISGNSISAIISQFETKSNSIGVQSKIKNKLKMSETETLQSEDMLYENENGNIQSKILINGEDTNIKTYRNRVNPSRGRSLINFVSWFVFLLSSVNGAIATTLTFIVLLPRALIKSLFYPGYRLLFGTLYPAYASYKAVRTRNVKEYVSFPLLINSNFPFLLNSKFFYKFAGKMDDVLDRFCVIFLHGNIHRHFSILVPILL